MKVVIAGSRKVNLTDANISWCVRQSGYQITHVISGAAKGVDKLAEEWAEKRNIAVIRRPADWNEYGKQAGFIRNSEMANIADAVIVIWDGESPGSKMMINTAVRKNLPTFVVNLKEKNWISYNELQLYETETK